MMLSALSRRIVQNGNLCKVSGFQSPQKDFRSPLCYFKAKTRLLGNTCQNVRTTTLRRMAVAAGVAAEKGAVEVSQRSQRIVGYWFLGCTGMVGCMVSLGGITRLTESGLSITKWDLIKGMVPPLSQKAWEDEFSVYQEFPEYKYKNSDMTVEEFKFIWLMEYAHRMWGRAIGLVYALPASYFWYKGWFTKQTKPRVLILGGLLLIQGVYGWYMVKSGLEDDPESTTIPRVSHYRLATHLTLAFLFYTGLLWSGLTHLLNFHDIVQTKQLQKFKRLAFSTKGLVFLTAISGAFVAGLDAGLVYNSYPKFADRWIPTDLMALEPKWKNWFDNPTAVQFLHRLLGEVSFCTIAYMWYANRKMPMPPRTRMALNSLVIIICTQVGLGITALLMYVPTWCGALHQIGALTTLSSAVWLTHELRKVPKI
ncbi:PREDICTED: cytochrome c oxidase assembly protein COX15 homolog [Priapulus caudatus]|uniref:Cytochrome c oxidase assembly protein COX15 homolog n=1 Tax=Priapulus caudatus TaxID=37621 RepID=A0ABM1EKN4_PRICU|nr:PREDICTED: cytochrome c oxidase assembly protein COX15 homolog [Priapulus caudatus]